MKNDTLKTLTEDARAAIVASICSIDFKALVDKTKSAGDEDAGSFRVVVSTADTDRQGESVNQLGWDLTFFKANPVVLWAHDYKSLPIGVCTSIDVKDGKLVAEGKFAPAAANPFAQNVRKLYDLGMVNTTSVGFIPKEYSSEKQGVIEKSELLEFSFVPVPANPHALRLSQIRELNLDTAMLLTKGIEIKEEAEAPVKDPEKPAEPAAAEPVKPAEGAEKGAVADELVAISNTKWGKYRSVCDVLDAFASAYFNEATPSEKFPELLLETIEILKLVAAGSDADADDMTEKKFGKDAVAQNKDALNAILRNYFALGSIKLPEGEMNAKAGDADAKRSKNSEALLEVNGFVETRELLRGIDISVEKALQNFNRAARNR